MKRYIILAALALAACSTKPTGTSADGPAWLFLGRGPYTLETKTSFTGPATMQLSLIHI